MAQRRNIPDQPRAGDQPLPIDFRADPPPLLIPEAVPDLVSVPAPPLDPVGLRCRDCGCRDLRVLETRRMSGGRIRRRRQCRHCGKRVTTTEHETFRAA